MTRRTATTMTIAVSLLLGTSCSLLRGGGGEQDGAGAPRRQLTRITLDRSVALARRYMLNSQTRRGNFVYQYDFVQHRVLRGDNAVRQAGALWCLALVHQENPTEETAAAVIRGLGFFKSISMRTRSEDRYAAGGRYIVYPGSMIGNTGAVALVGLTLVEFLRADFPVPRRKQYERDLEEYILFLRSLRRSDKLFYSTYDPTSPKGVGLGDPSPYSDGETLLLLVKAAKYAGHLALKDVALESADAMHWNHFTSAVAEESDSDIAKAYYQWGSMAYYELHTSSWPGVDKYATRALDMAHWMIDVHGTVARKGNTSAAMEGLAVAWELARLTRRQEDMDKIAPVIDTVLSKLITWQVGGPDPNKFLRKHRTEDGLAVGGAMGGEADPILRIDVTQHQLHAMMLARRFIYKQ